MTVSLRQKRQSEFFSLWQFIYDISVSYEQAANYEIFVVYARNEYRAFYMTYCQEKMTTSIMIDTKFSRDPPVLTPEKQKMTQTAVENLPALILFTSEKGIDTVVT